MKNKLFTSLSLLLLSLFIYSCSTDEIEDQLEELLPETTVLETITVKEATLEAGKESEVFDTYKWSEVKYNNIVASTYELRLYLNEKHSVLKSTSELTASITVGEMNTAIKELTDSTEPVALKVAVVSKFAGAIETESESQALTVTMIKEKEEPKEEEPKEEEQTEREPHANDGIWGVIGTATANGWDSDQDMLYDEAEEQYTLVTDLVEGEMKFRKDNDWAVNLGGALDALVKDGDNLLVTEAGNYTITLKVDESGESVVGTATITKN